MIHASGSTDPGQYCRDIEAYLCRKNDGHLIRVVGPSFERVCAWAAQGIPLKVAFRGIDRYFERYYARGKRRHPVRLDFCEADVLDVFDEWRRAVGVPVSAAAEEAADFGADAPVSSRRRVGLPAHLDRLLERIASRQAEAGVPVPVDELLDRVREEIASFGEMKAPVRGEARTRVSARLAELDRELVDTARRHCDPTVLDSLQSEAAEQLEPFRERMPEEAYLRARFAAVDRLVRERARLPVLTFE
jgi:hypothetical protein